MSGRVVPWDCGGCRDTGYYTVTAYVLPGYGAVACLPYDCICTCCAEGRALAARVGKNVGDRLWDPPTDKPTKQGTS